VSNGRAQPHAGASRKNRAGRGAGGTKRNKKFKSRLQKNHDKQNTKMQIQEKKT
jgi:hypothetical protein